MVTNVRVCITCQDIFTINLFSEVKAITFMRINNINK